MKKSRISDCWAWKLGISTLQGNKKSLRENKNLAFLADEWQIPNYPLFLPDLCHQPKKQITRWSNWTVGSVAAMETMYLIDLWMHLPNFAVHFWVGSQDLRTYMLRHAYLIIIPYTNILHISVHGWLVEPVVTTLSDKAPFAFHTPQTQKQKSGFWRKSPAQALLKILCLFDLLIFFALGFWIWLYLFEASLILLIVSS